MSAWLCDWKPDDLNPGPDCPYCAGEMCARFDGLGCTHGRIERHGYAPTIERHGETIFALSAFGASWGDELRVGDVLRVVTVHTDSTETAVTLRKIDGVSHA